MFYNFSKVYVSFEELAVKRMHVDPDRLLYKSNERILFFFLKKSNSFYHCPPKHKKNVANPLKKTKIRREMTDVPSLRPFFERYG